MSSTNNIALPSENAPEFITLYENSIDLINYARHVSSRQVNMIQLLTFYALGKWIVDEQQNGQQRAAYGKQVISGLSAALNAHFGKGFSEDTLKNARKFYLTYKDRISETVFSLLEKEPPFTVPWSHYLLQMRIKNEDERRLPVFMRAKSDAAYFSRITGSLLHTHSQLHLMTAFLHTNGCSGIRPVRSQYVERVRAVHLLWR